MGWSRKQMTDGLNLLGPPVIAGAILRLLAIQRQILVDDEWHALNFVIDKSFLAVLTTQGMGANSIPQNIYTWLALHTVGWSELILRAPSLLFGILAVIVSPVLAATLIDRRTAAVFAWLLAIAPCAVFYSRLCRPYSMVLFFGFAAIMAFCLWIKRGGAGWMLFYAGAGFIAVYGHLYSALFVLSPLVVVFFLAIVQIYRRKTFRFIRIPPLRAIIAAGGIFGGLSCLLLLPAVFANPWWENVLGEDHATLSSLWNLLSLVSGTGSIPLKILMAAGIVYGIVGLTRRDAAIGMVLATICGMFAFFLIFGTQDGMHAAIQIARYAIVLLPAFLLLIAVTVDRVCAAIEREPRLYRLAGVVPVLLIAVLLLESPLRQTYVRPNNFTNQSAFQDSYAPFDWSKSRVRDLTPQPQMAASDVPEVYRYGTLLAQAPGIIEYPMFVGDPVNLYYFYQHFHKRPVAAGYLMNLHFPQLASQDDFVCQLISIDYILSRAVQKYHDRIRFTTMVPLDDARLLLNRYQDWLIIVHRDVTAEMIGQPMRKDFRACLPLAASDLLIDTIGDPIVADPHLIVWRIPGLSDGGSAIR